MKTNAFEVLKNGQVIGTLGLTREGLIGGMIEIKTDDRGRGNAFLHLHGLENLGAGQVKYLEWESVTLSENDEITFRILTAQKVASPTSTRTETRAKQETLKYQHYVELKKYFSKHGKPSGA